MYIGIAFLHFIPLPSSQEWTGQELTQCSLYGIRIYTEGSVLATHVDRLPLVSSAIINIAQDVDEPWPIEVYGHDGKATNVTMEPGDMVLYESHSVLHGRPFPLKGRFYANIFVHFEPVGHSLRHNQKLAQDERHVNEKYREAVARGVGGHEVDQGNSDLPPYIIPGTPEETNWRRNHPSGQRSKQRSFATGTTQVHYAAQVGDLETIKKFVEKDKSIVTKTDSNGWTPTARRCPCRSQGSCQILVRIWCGYQCQDKWRSWRNSHVVGQARTWRRSRNDFLSGKSWSNRCWSRLVGGLVSMRMQVHVYTLELVVDIS